MADIPLDAAGASTDAQQQSITPDPQAALQSSPPPTQAPTDVAAPAPDPTAVNIYDITGKQPVMGTIAPEEVTEAVASGKYSPPTGAPVDVISPDGTRGTMDPSEAHEAFKNGYRYATPVDYQKEQYQDQGLAATAEAGARGVLGPIATGAERMLGVSGKDILGREQAHPGLAAAGEIGGLGASMLTGVGEGKLLEMAGDAAAHGIGATSTVGKIGSAIVKGAAENAIYSGGDSASKMIAGDPNTTVQTAIINAGLSGLIGGTISGGIGTVSPLWKAVHGDATGSLLKSISDRLGGVEGEAIKTPIDDAIIASGIDLPPALRAAATDDPQLKEWASKLSQTDVNKAGKSFQKDIAATYGQAQEQAAQALGKNLDEIPAKGEVSDYDTGKNIGETLAKEYQTKLTPMANEFEAIKGKYKDAPLIPDGIKDNGGLLDMSNPYAPKPIPNERTPGTISTLSDQLGQLANKEGWIGAKNDIENELGRVMAKLPKLEKVSDISELMTQVGNNTKSTLPFGQQTPLSRAGQMIKGVLQNSEELTARQHLGEQAPELIDRYDAARKAYRGQAQLKEALDDRLHIGGSISGFGKGLTNMAKTDAETMLKRLSGRGDADLLNLMQKEFPETAAKIGDYHRSSLLSAAKDGDGLSVQKLRTALSKMSPELRAFSVTPESAAKIDSIGTVMDALKDPTHNWSNTARTAQKLNRGSLGSALGFITAMTGHASAGVSLLLGKLAELTQQEAPDAVRYSLMKFLGSKGGAHGPAFKATVDLMHNAIKGDNLATKAAQSLFKSGVKVLPAHLVTSDTDRSRLEKHLKNVQKNQASLTATGQDLAHFMPDHGTAAASVAANASTYLNSLRPSQDTANPLDSKPAVTKAQQATYNNALNIAHQPLSVISKIKDGTITSTDITHLNAMYPALLPHLQSKVMTAMTEHVDKGETIPYRNRLGISLFLGQPLDSTMTPQGIMGAQPTPVPPMQQQTASGGMKNKKGSKALDKAPNQYKTALQSAESDRADRS